MIDRIEYLEKVTPLLPEKDRAFAADLCVKGRKYTPSEKQAYWIEKMIERATVQSDEQDAPKSDDLGNVDWPKLVGLFVQAGSKLKYPKLSFEEDGFKLVIKRAGSGSKYSGDLMLTDGGPFGSNLWYGRITSDGQFVSSRVGEQYRDRLLPLLRAFVQDPHGFASTYGKKSGNCCFCAKEIGHGEGKGSEKSKAVGYGPVCAKNWGLEKEWNAAA